MGNLLILSAILLVFNAGDGLCLHGPCGCGDKYFESYVSEHFRSVLNIPDDVKEEDLVNDKAVKGLIDEEKPMVLSNKAGKRRTWLWRR